MTIRTRPISYTVGEKSFEGLLAWEATAHGRRPGILVSHTIRGRGAFEEHKAKRLAESGFVAMALDVYGRDQLGGDDARNRANMDALKADRVELQRRMMASLAALAEQPEVDSNRLAAIGYCFGGLCVLDLARIPAPVAGVVSFHGLFEPPENTAGNRSKVKVLALHGWDDPLATPDAVVAAGRELTALGCDWQIHAYGHTMHAFTNPAADDNERGTVYDAEADRRSWRAMRDFLADLFP